MNQQAAIAMLAVQDGGVVGTADLADTLAQALAQIQELNDLSNGLRDGLEGVMGEVAANKVCVRLGLRLGLVKTTVGLCIVARVHHKPTSLIMPSPLSLTGTLQGLGDTFLNLESRVSALEAVPSSDLHDGLQNLSKGLLNRQLYMVLVKISMTILQKMLGSAGSKTETEKWGGVTMRESLCQRARHRNMPHWQSV